MIRLRRAILALPIACALAATPASANSVSLTLTPRGESAQAVRTGLAIYGLFQDIKKNKGRIDQRGSGNAAALGQSGSGNNARIIQRGNGHTGTVTQNGSNNYFGLIQLGRRTTSHVNQSGDGNVGVRIQAGW